MTIQRFLRSSACLLTVLACLAVPGAHQANAAESALDRVKQDGLLRCGVINSGVGVSEIDRDGIWRGFFPDFCRVLAAAVTGDAEAVEFVEVNYVVRFEALNSDAFDVLMANTTWTTTRDTELGLAFTQPIFYDGQGFLAHRSLGVESLKDVEKATVCVSRNTTTLKNLEDLIATTYPGLEPVAFESIEAVYDSFFSRRCDMMTQDRVALVSQRLNRASNTDNIILLSDIVSKEPLGPAIRQDDPLWLDVVQWAIYATILAEEHGISQENVDSFLDSRNPEIRRLLGVDPGIGAKLGLSESWAVNIIRQVGNYGEIYARNVGSGSDLNLERGLNALWTDGGIVYAPPLR